VISTNRLAPLVAGRLNRGDPAAAVRYVTKDTPDAKATFLALADLGCEGCPTYAQCGPGETTDAGEGGLEAVRLALSDPLTADTATACEADADCKADPGVCGNPDACPLQCVEGQCRGWNRGFLRDDAMLQVVVISDEDDASPLTVVEYVNEFKNIKGFYNTSMAHFNAIVGPAGGCVGADGSTAEPGTRYAEMAEETSGYVGSFCASDLWLGLGSIGPGPDWVPKVQYFLSQLADPATIHVSVDGVACTSGWKYNAPSNSVIFDSNGPCMPQPGDKITVTYSTLCLGT
jgi:hypothetical protein